MSVLQLLHVWERIAQSRLQAHACLSTILRKDMTFTIKLLQ